MPDDRPPDRARAPIILVGLTASFLACGGGETGLSGPGDGGDDLRPGLTVALHAAPGSGAETLGWEAGVPGAEVRIHRIGTDFAWETAPTDANGVARFPDAVNGRYRIAGYRPLTDGETATAGGVLAFGGGLIASVADGGEVSVELGPSQEPGLVISEVYATAPFVAETNYDFHYYFELYNNSDQTVFLDGMLFGSTLGLGMNESEIDPCSAQESWLNESRGVWAHFLNQFPGGGTSHPLAPGEIATVALDAIDHGAVVPGLPDLSGADFEMLGSGDVDNPSVPNLTEVGIGTFPGGHGLRFFIGHNLFIAEAVDPGSLERATRVQPGLNDTEFLLVPAAAIIDLVATEKDNALEDQSFPPCYPRIHGSFDRLSGGFVKHGEDVEFSVQRIPIGTTNGRVILQDTNTSAVDLVKALFKPGSLP